MKKYLITTFLTILFQFINAQSFIEPLENISSMLGSTAVVYDTKGNESEGKLSSGLLVMGHLKSFSLKSEDGTKRKFKSSDVQLLKVKVSGLMKFSMAAESLTSIKNVTKTDYDEISNKEWLIFEQALINRKKEKPRLLQLLNPGFDSKIKVYVDPNAKKTGGMKLGGLKMGGGEDKSFLLVKNQAKAVKVKKGKYSKSFEELFDDCPVMNETFGGSKTKFKDLAGHVFVYDQSCQ